MTRFLLVQLVASITSDEHQQLARDEESSVSILVPSSVTVVLRAETPHRKPAPWLFTGGHMPGPGQSIYRQASLMGTFNMREQMYSRKLTWSSACTHLPDRIYSLSHLSIVILLLLSSFLPPPFIPLSTKCDLANITTFSNHHPPAITYLHTWQLLP